MPEPLKPMFPYFGGKGRVADIVWNYLGDVGLYVEPFAGSLAMLLKRPAWHKARAEMVNDIDCFIVNFWRAMKHDAIGVMKYAKDNVNEADLVARNNWLVENARRIRDATFSDPDFYDAKAAGWWVWGQCGSIAAVYTRSRSTAKLPNGDVQGVLLESRDAAYFEAVSSRISNVRIANGEWNRVLTKGYFSQSQSDVGIFLDPPYSGRIEIGIYKSEGGNISSKVREWCIENGNNPKLKIVLAGYYDEHGGKMPKGWEEHKYKGGTSFRHAESKKKMEMGEGGNAENRHKETLWISPHCRRAAGGLLGATVATTKIRKV